MAVNDNYDSEARADAALERAEAGVDPKTKLWSERNGCDGEANPDGPYSAKFSTAPDGWKGYQR